MHALDRNERKEFESELKRKNERIVGWLCGRIDSDWLI